MRYLLLFGLFSWILIGLAVAATAPGLLRMGRTKALLVAVAGALAGGLLATGLGFGGLASFDLRSLITAGLGSLAALLIARLLA